MDTTTLNLGAAPGSSPLPRRQGSRRRGNRRIGRDRVPGRKLHGSIRRHEPTERDLA